MKPARRSRAITRRLWTTLQERLARLLVAHIVHKRKALDRLRGLGRGGKGGAIQRLTAEWDPRAFKVWPIAAPTDEEKARHFLWRFWKRLPGPARSAIFDRSWYGRVLVERVEGFATEAEWRRAYDEINEFEAQQASDGTHDRQTVLPRHPGDPGRALKARLDHPWKRWKVTAEDFRNRARRDDYLAAIKDMFERTDTRWAPWTVIDGNDKKAARIAALTAVADALEARCRPSRRRSVPKWNSWHSSCHENGIDRRADMVNGRSSRGRIEETGDERARDHPGDGPRWPWPRPAARPRATMPMTAATGPGRGSPMTASFTDRASTCSIPGCSTRPEGRAVVTLGFSEAANGLVSEDVAHRANIWFRRYADENCDMRVTDPEIRTALVTATGRYLR